MEARFREQEPRRQRSQTRGKLCLKGGHGQALVWRQEEGTFLPSGESNGEKVTKSGSQVRAVAGRPSGPAALFALAQTALCGDAFRLTCKCGKQKVFCPRRRVSRFPVRPRVRATVLTRPPSCQWALCSHQEGQPLLNVMVWSDPSQGWKTELIQLRPRVLGFEPATVSILREDEKLIIGRV